MDKHQAGAGSRAVHPVKDIFYITPVLPGGKQRIGQTPETIRLHLTLRRRKEYQCYHLFPTRTGNRCCPECHFHFLNSSAVLTFDPGVIAFIISSRNPVAENKDE